MSLFPTTIAGSLPKPGWLAEPNRLWPAWQLSGPALAEAKRDATLLALKLQEDSGIDIVSDGEQSRQHFVHGFLECVDGIDFSRRVEIGIRADRYKAMVPTVTSTLRLNARVHASEARLARAHTNRKLKFTLPGPMTIVDTIADAYYGDRVKMVSRRPAAQYRGAGAASGVASTSFNSMSLHSMSICARWGMGH
jgi:5-methyltetrahydropteroyltriglutamate--homocysteine methyltransferase